MRSISSFTRDWNGVGGFRSLRRSSEIENIAKRYSFRGRPLAGSRGFRRLSVKSRVALRRTSTRVRIPFSFATSKLDLVWPPFFLVASKRAAGQRTQSISPCLVGCKPHRCRHVQCEVDVDVLLTWADRFRTGGHRERAEADHSDERRVHGARHADA